jgi:hypothetical protein
MGIYLEKEDIGNGYILDYGCFVHRDGCQQEIKQHNRLQRNQLCPVTGVRSAQNGTSV